MSAARGLHVLVVELESFLAGRQVLAKVCSNDTDLGSIPCLGAKKLPRALPEQRAVAEPHGPD